jgi:hypothetical protein
MIFTLKYADIDGDRLPIAALLRSLVFQSNRKNACAGVKNDPERQTRVKVKYKHLFYVV